MDLRMFLAEVIAQSRKNPEEVAHILGVAFHILQGLPKGVAPTIVKEGMDTVSFIPPPITEADQKQIAEATEPEPESEPEPKPEHKKPAHPKKKAHTHK